MASAIDQRNQKARQIVEKWLASVKGKSHSLEITKKYAREIRILEELIPIEQKGFRGVVLTAIVGKFLDADFKPLENFYDCNPRSIFEHGIFYALEEYRIPSGKSDPLNVAKNIQKLDYAWAKGRRPESAARAAVDFLKALERNWDDDIVREELLFLYFTELSKYGEYVDSQNAPLVSFDGIVPIEVAEKLAAFALECPEGGAMPQFIVGELLSISRSNDGRYSKVGGVGESVFGTNTTSNKPADIWEILKDGSFGELYEITVKTIDQKRLDDCVDALKKIGIPNRRITFVCNLPADAEKLDHKNGMLIHKGVNFQFLDISDFILQLFCLLRDEDRDIFMKSLEQFLGNTNRQIKTKEYWKRNFTAA